MNTTELELMRLLHGELTGEPARRLRERLERDPALAETYDRLRRSWESLALPPAAPVPPGFSQRTMARIRVERASRGVSWSLSWNNAPVWVRATAAAALVAGTVLGIGVGGRIPLAQIPVTETPAVVQGTSPFSPSQEETPPQVAVSPEAPQAPQDTAPQVTPAQESPSADLGNDSDDMVDDIDLVDDTLAASYWDALDVDPAGATGATGDTALEAESTESDGALP